jgi:hypothetical protein
MLHPHHVCQNYCTRKSIFTLRLSPDLVYFSSIQVVLTIDTAIQGRIQERNIPIIVACNCFIDNAPSVRTCEYIANIGYSQQHVAFQMPLITHISLWLTAISIYTIRS